MGASEVAAGAAWLDENFPGWERKIDLGTFDIDDCQNCICGQSLREVAQTAGAYSGYDYVKSINGGSWTGGWQWAVKHGFSATLRDDWEELETLWRDLIKERFNSGNLSDNGDGNDE